MSGPHDTDPPWPNLSNEQLDELNAACDAFERVWQEGSRPYIGDYVGDATGEYRHALLVELIRLDSDYSHQAGDMSSPGMYHERFPHDADAINQAFQADSHDGIALTVLIPRSALGNMDDSPIPESIDTYKIIKQIGCGGAGRVLLAEDTSLNRRVAIKLLRTDLSSPAMTDSLQGEAKRVAQLEGHHGIVPVYTVGLHDGHPYVVYKFIEGQRLDEWSRQQRPTYERLARVMAAVADALAYIHSQGVIHRDIKPANIIVNYKDQPMLVDFGLALSRIDAANASRGIACGTPEFLSPEQVLGRSHEVNGATDIYSLGATLYMLLTGQPPFRCHGTDASALRRLADQIVSDDPQPPRQLHHDIPEELQRICIKAMAKDRALRYHCAADLHRDLLRFIAQGSASATSDVSAVKITHPGATGAIQLPGHSTFIRERFAECRRFVGHHWHVVDVAVSPDGEMVASCGNDNQVLLWDFDTLEELGRFRLAARVTAVAFSMCGRFAAWSGWDGNVYLWDRKKPARMQRVNWWWRRHRNLVWDIAFAPDGRFLVTTSGGVFNEGDIADGDDNGVRVWSTRTGAYLGSLGTFPLIVYAVEVSPDGKWIAVAGQDKRISIFDAATGRVRNRMVGHDDTITSLAFASDGRILVSGSLDGTVRLWDLMAHRELACLRGHTAAVWSVATAPSERIVASAGWDSTIRLWDLDLNHEIACCRDHSDWVNGVAFSSDGRHIISASGDQTVRIWLRTVVQS